jgi:hypothetical protein
MFNAKPNKISDGLPCCDGTGTSRIDETRVDTLHRRPSSAAIPPGKATSTGRLLCCVEPRKSCEILAAFLTVHLSKLCTWAHKSANEARALALARVILSWGCHAMGRVPCRSMPSFESKTRADAHQRASPGLVASCPHGCPRWAVDSAPTSTCRGSSGAGTTAAEGAAPMSCRATGADLVRSGRPSS